MNKIKVKPILIFLGVFLVLEVFSFLGFTFTWLNQLLFIGIALLTTLASIYKLEYGVLIVLAELIVGSKGYLFYFPIEGRLIGIRLVIWSILMVVFTAKFLLTIKKEGKNSLYLKRIKSFPYIKQYTTLAFFVIIGLVSAFIYQNNLSNIFLDFNAWIYFLILLPLIVINLDREKLFNIFIAGSIWVSIKTLILLGIFSHGWFADETYSWLRKTLVGEMTASTGWKRVFIQSQIFPIIAYIFLLFKIKLEIFRDLISKNNIIYLLLITLFSSTILISLSRSFWLGFGVVLLISLIYFWITQSFKKAFLIGLGVFSSLILAIGLIIIIVTPRSAGSFQDQILERVANKEQSAIVSRWKLLPVLVEAIEVNPISGQGFGKTVTYISSDPRILENEASGKYTTYAFEWGYLDIWLKLGILGLAAYIWLLYSIIKDSFRLANQTKKYFYLGLAFGCLFLSVVHIFTPYINHPLGIGFIVITSCLILKDRVY